jgi:hypothetical protein
MTERYASHRRHPRYKVDVQVKVSVDSTRFAARTRDISRAGLCLVGMKPIARDTEISLEMILTFGPDGASEPLQLTGRVAWCTALFGAYQIGIKFVNIDADRGRYLDMFVGFLDGTLAPGPMFPEDDDARRGDPDDPFVFRK